MISKYFRHLDQRNVISATDGLIAKNDSRLTRADAFDQALDWDMIREMAGSGLATFGGHTVSHPLLRQLDRASLVAEIGGCRHRLREAGGIEPAKIRKLAHSPRLSPKKSTSLRPSRHMRALPRVMLSRKAQNEWIVRAYHSGLPAMIRELWPRHEPVADCTSIGSK